MTRSLKILHFFPPGANVRLSSVRIINVRFIYCLVFPIVDLHYNFIAITHFYFSYIFYDPKKDDYNALTDVVSSTSERISLTIIRFFGVFEWNFQLIF